MTRRPPAPLVRRGAAPRRPPFRGPRARRLIACGVLLFLAALVLGACGEKSEPELSGPAVPMQPRGSDERAQVGDGRGGVALRQIGEFDQPTFLAQPPGGRRALYVVEQGGRVVRVDGRGRTSTFLDISARVACCGEQGLLGLAFAPDYRTSGRFYVDYTDRRGDTRVVEYRAGRRGGRERAIPGSARELLRVKQPEANHNGGMLAFGPDGYLYVGLGDGGGAGDPDRNGQDLGTLLGKILRLDPRPEGDRPYRIPADNPLADRADARPEIALWGLRNPWRFSFDRERGTLWIGDVGEGAREEVDVVADPARGANLGWSAYEGSLPFNDDERAPGALDPVLEYGRERGCSITGGYVVRDRRLTSLYGRYLYGDYCNGQLRSFPAREALPGPVRDDRALGPQVPALSSFAEDGRGRIYALSLEGPVYRLVPAR